MVPILSQINPVEKEYCDLLHGLPIFVSLRDSQIHLHLLRPRNKLNANFATLAAKIAYSNPELAKKKRAIFANICVSVRRYWLAHYTDKKFFPSNNHKMPFLGLRIAHENLENVWKQGVVPRIFGPTVNSTMFETRSKQYNNSKGRSDEWEKAVTGKEPSYR
jgi:hypothetical protein